MADIVLPGTYITVRDEGLISAGAVSTGNIGIVGEALEGDPGQVYVLSSYTDAKAAFGPKANVNYTDAQNAAATLLKSLDLLFSNGASIVYAVRAADGSTVAYQNALALLEKEIINIVLLSGKDASSADLINLLTSHLTTTEGINRERVGVIGCRATSDVGQILTDYNQVVNDKGRIIYVAPGVSVTKRDPATGNVTTEVLSGAYMAAALVGLLSSLPVQTSPTNKTLNITGLAAVFNYGELSRLVSGKVLAVEMREGYRVVKGITTSTNLAWHQITTRRIVDYAIYGVRSACNPYIGKLNNERVRNAMKATLDGFLTRMVDSEALIAYTLDVSATRAQEIAGQAIVTMTLNPTFSIDFIEVTMSLG